jgi:subtilisin
VKPLPAWSLARGEADGIALASDWPEHVSREWAWAGSTGAGTRVCIVDSGIDGTHPDVGPLERAVVVATDADGNDRIEDDDAGDVAGHGTACAGIVRSIAPDCAITSVRVLGSRARGSSTELMAGLRWAISQEFDVVNLSLSTSRRDVAAVLHELADTAYFRRTLLVAAAHNVSVESFPWRFASVISVGSHEGEDPFQIFYNPSPPVEFFARGVNVEVPWPGGVRVRVTGNSFAAAFVSGLCALVRAGHPALTPFQVKGALHLLADNVHSRHGQG